MDYVSGRDHHASACSPKRLSRCSRRETFVALWANLRDSVSRTHWPVVSGGRPALRRLVSVSRASAVGFNSLATSVAILSMYSKIFGASARVGTVIAVSVQEDIVVALANVKHSVGLFENLVAASSEPGRCG